MCAAGRPARSAPQMPHKTAARLRELMDELNRAQSESGDTADKARQELAGVMRSGELRPASEPIAQQRSKLGRKKR
jgi:hypothetical protein